MGAKHPTATVALVAQCSELQEGQITSMGVGYDLRDERGVEVDEKGCKGANRIKIH